MIILAFFTIIHHPCIILAKTRPEQKQKKHQKTIHFHARAPWDDTRKYKIILWI